MNMFRMIFLALCVVFHISCIINPHGLLHVEQEHISYDAALTDFECHDSEHEETESHSHEHSDSSQIAYLPFGPKILNFDLVDSIKVEENHYFIISGIATYQSIFFRPPIV